MLPFTRLRATAAPLDRANVNTDELIPARLLRKPVDEHYGRYLFHDLRFTPEGQERAEFVLNQAPYRQARILVADVNFGCGSSRENAVWVLNVFGIRCVIAPSFSDIFYNNACKNGLLPVRLVADEAAALRQALHAAPGSEVEVDLEAQSVVSPSGQRYRFDIDAFRKSCLLGGLDDIGLTLAHAARIDAHERDMEARRPWMSPVSGKVSP